MTDKIEFRTLRADEIEVRVGEKRDGRMTLLLYQDARCAMNILDETLGNFGWACQYKEEKGTLFAGIAIKAQDGTWVWKWDAGAPSNFEREKGESSDAFKRAAVRWSLGRELYTAPKIRIPESNATHRVKFINYDSNRRIKDLQIVDWNDKVVFSYTNGKVDDRNEQTVDNVELLRTVCGELKYDRSVDKEQLLEFFNYYHKKVRVWEHCSERTIRKKWEEWQANG